MDKNDLISAEIVEQIEIYLTEGDLKTDYTLVKYASENNGWIRLELLNRYKKLSSHSYERILSALCSKQSNIIELSSFEPRCIRRRCQPLAGDNNRDNQTVVITGLPSNIRYEELFEFFNKFYSIKDISLANRFNQKIHVIFNKSEDAQAFVQQSKIKPIIFSNPNLLQSCNGYTITCKMLNDQGNFLKGKSFSTRLTNHTTRVPLNTNISSTNNTSDQKKSCLKSNTCATEQILFCQNLPKNKTIKNCQYDKQKIVFNKYSYEFYIPDHLLKQIHPCIIISLLNPYCFTIQLRQDAVEFDKFQREINVFYNTIDDKDYYITPEQISINLCVICSDTKTINEKTIWNRSQILDYDPSDNTVNLFYVDLGTWDEYVPINRLRHITDRFHQHLVFSITCRLAHIIPLNNDNDQLTWTDDATNQFSAVIEQSTSEIEFLSFTPNACFQTNLFVINSNQQVCVNDYMIHIKQAKPIDNITNSDDNRRNSLQSNDGNGSSTHPVVALYNRFGEILQQSLTESRTTSISSSSMSSPSTLPKIYVKMIYVDINNTQDYNNQQIPMIFVLYKKTILVPDFNIITMLKLINSNIDIHTIENYAFAIRYNGVYITQESNFDIFTQLSSLIDAPYPSSIGLYTLDFFDYILKHYKFRLTNIWFALENAKHAQLNASDPSLWFTMDNEFRFSKPVTPQQPLIPYRLPFSNRLINPI